MTDMNPLTMGDDIIVFSVAFGPDAVEVDFLDPRRQAKGLTEVTKLAIERTLMGDEIEELEERMRDLIDEALTTRRK